MMCSVGVFRTGLLFLLMSLVLSGCLPAAPTDEEKEPHFLAGRSRVNTMDFKGAIESFEKALEVNPKSASAHFELGWLYDQKESDPAAAIYHYQCYLKLAPNSPKEEMIKSHILACKQQLAQAVSLVPGMEKQQRELELLAEENRRLREEIDKWHAYALRLQGMTNQLYTALRTARTTYPVNSDRPGAGGPSATVMAAPGRSTAAATVPPRTHTVRAGETLSLIARKYGVKLEALVAANPKVEPRRLQIGQALIIPMP
jgi:tetratricopeptide (TPR) repeat protein